MICAKSPGKSACYGDSGGPFMIKEGKRFKNHLQTFISLTDNII